VTRQTTRTRKAKRETAKAEDFIRQANEAAATAPAATAPKRQSIDKVVAELGITAEAIEDARDVQRLSWRDVAKLLGLANPGQARKAYEHLTGRPHDSAPPVGRRARNGSSSSSLLLKPNWDDYEFEDIEAMLAGKTIVVRTAHGEDETLGVYTITGLADVEPHKGTPCPPFVSFIEGYASAQGMDKKTSTGHHRYIELDRILEVR
jgi:hypothetical protein